MHPLAHTTLALAFAALLPIQPSAAQSRSSVAAATPAAVGAVANTSTDFSEHANRARSLLEQGRFKEARREYASLAKRQRDQNVFAGEALWMVAQLQFGSGNIHQAASTLDRLADEAQVYGEPEHQARALLEAAILYQRTGQGQRAMERIQRLKPLSASPFLSDDMRSQIKTRIRG